MRQIILVVLIMCLALWYAGIGNNTLVENENKIYYTPKEVKELYAQGIIKKPDYTKIYSSKEKVSYIRNRSIIPLFYDRDTVQSSGLSYYSEE